MDLCGGATFGAVLDLASKHLASLRAWAGTWPRIKHTRRTTENGDMTPDGRFGRRALARNLLCGATTLIIEYDPYKRA
eukprot:4975017-Prymnesium_polylepis.2